MLGGSTLARLTQPLGRMPGHQTLGKTSVKLEPEVRVKSQTYENVKTAAFFFKMLAPGGSAPAAKRRPRKGYTQGPA